MAQTSRLTIAVFHETRRWSLPSVFVDRIAKAGGDSVETRAVTTRSELNEALPETEYLVGLPPSDELLFQRGGSLKWIQLTGSLGDLELSLLPALRSGVRVTTSASIRAAQIAEHAMALALGLTRKLDLAATHRASQMWAPDVLAKQLKTLRGRSMGIIAQESVGEEIAKRAKAFGMHVLATRRAPENGHAQEVASEFVDEALPASQLSELLGRSDVVVVAAPWVPATEGLIGKTQLGQMKREAILVDVSHGGIVHQSALEEALRKQRIAGAGLDVFDREPLPPHSSMWSLPNVIVTPHVASASPDYWADATAMVCENLRRLQNDEPLLDEVSEQWYTPTTRR